MPCVEWYTSVDSRRLSTVELKSKAFLAVDSGACRHSDVMHVCFTCAITQAGAGAVLMLPGITGFDVMRMLAMDDEFNLPILCHP
eukprot:1196317-Prorocentrum_minimum.AAC.1